MSRRRWLVRTPEEHEIVLEHGYGSGMGFDERE